MTANPLLSVNFAQIFYLDPSLVRNASQIGISRVDLYCRAKPPASNNRSGILNPGVEVTILECINGVPNLFMSQNTNIRARVEWGQIVATTDASSPTVFEFSKPIFLNTGKEYAVALKFDGNEDFIFWTSKKNDLLVGTQQVSPGVSGPNVGRYFSFISPINSVSGNTLITEDVDYLTNNWTPINDTDLKFKLYVARFSHNQIPVFANSTIANNPIFSSSFHFSGNNNVIVSNNGTITTIAQAECNEFITFDLKYSILNTFYFGEKVYQPAPFYPGGTATPVTVTVSSLSVLSTPLAASRIVANAAYLLPNGISFFASGGFNSIYSGVGNEYVIVQSGNNVNIRKIVQIVSPVELLVDEPFTFSNNRAFFMKAPVGKLKYMESSYLQGFDTPTLILSDSNSNASVRFVNNTLLDIDITNSGRGYSNSDYLVINGYEDVNFSVKGGYSATANIVTSPNGNVLAIYISNSGAGFVNSAWLADANVKVLNSSGLPVLDSIANNLQLDFEIGSNLKTEFDSNTLISNTTIINIETVRTIPEMDINAPLGTSYDIRHRMLYYKSNDAVYVMDNPANSDIYVKNMNVSSLVVDNTELIIPSRSNQYVIRYANGSIATPNVIGINASNASVYLFDLVSNNDFVATYVNPEVCRGYYSKYIVNDDYVDEHTNYGNAHSKHITTKVTFGERFAEDLVVYLTAWKPVNTDIKVYARIHNSNDPEAFDDKDWTLLELIDGVGLNSSKDNPTDFIELTYNFTAYPNTSVTCNGSVNLVQGSAVLTGSGTTFNTQLEVGDLVKVYTPLFPNNYFVAVVNSIANATSLTLKRSLGDLGANLTGTVHADSAITDIEGTSSKFLTDFQSGDYIAVWANATFYDVRQVNIITSDTAMNVTSVFSFANAAANYSKLSSNNLSDFSVSGSGLRVDKLAYVHQAFNNQPNENVVRYYNNNMVEYDGYNTFQIKVVLLSNSEYIVPKVDDIRSVGTST